MKVNLLTILAILLFNNSLFAQNKDVRVTKFDSCSSIGIINFNLSKSANKDHNALNIFVLRAESTHNDGTKETNPIEDYIVDYDTAIIRIISYELETTSYAQTCDFSYTLDGIKTNRIKPIPPIMCITSTNKDLLNLIKKKYNLAYNPGNDTYLSINEAYKTPEEFFEYLNSILKGYNNAFVSSIVGVEPKIPPVIEPPKASNTQTNDISLLYSPSPLNKVLFSTNDPKDISISQAKINAVQFKYRKYFEKNKNIGLSFALEYWDLGFKLGLNENSKLIDTLNSIVIDKDVQAFKQMASGENLNENIQLKYLNYIIGLSYKISPKLDNVAMNIVLNGGMKVSNLISGTFNASKGKQSMGGIYTHDSLNWWFNEAYGFYKDKPVNTEKQTLDLANMYLSGVFSIDCELGSIKKTNLLFNLSLFGETGSNILNQAHSDNQLAGKSNNYNSMLYRYDTFKVNNLGIRFGFTYVLKNIL